METTKKFFNYEIELLMNFKGFTFSNYKIGSIGQKIYYFLCSDDEINEFNIRTQGSFIFNITKPTNECPFSFSKIDNHEIIIIDWSETGHIWNN